MQCMVHMEGTNELASIAQAINNVRIVRSISRRMQSTHAIAHAFCKVQNGPVHLYPSVVCCFPCLAVTEPLQLSLKRAVTLGAYGRPPDGCRPVPKGSICCRVERPLSLYLSPPPHRRQWQPRYGALLVGTATFLSGEGACEQSGSSSTYEEIRKAQSSVLPGSTYVEE
jgi:hypothetical protein